MFFLLYEYLGFVNIIVIVNNNNVDIFGLFYILNYK